MDLFEAEQKFYQLIKNAKDVETKRTYVASLIGLMGDDSHCLRLAASFFVMRADARLLDDFVDFCAESARQADGQE